MSKMTNTHIRLAICEANLLYKDIADQMGIGRVWFSRMLSRPLSKSNEERVRNAIDILTERQNHAPINPIQFCAVECVESGNGFIKGCYYAQVGTNNGIQIQRTNENGDCETYLFCTGGIGKGEFNAWDETGKPSFVGREVKIK